MYANLAAQPKVKIKSHASIVLSIDRVFLVSINIKTKPIKSVEKTLHPYAIAQQNVYEKTF